MLTGVRVGLYDHEAFRRHDAGPGHPERPERLEALRRGLRPLEPRLQLLTPPEASRPELLRVHAPEHVEAMARSEGRTLQLDPDTQASPDSYRAALRAAGAVVAAVDGVLAGRLERAFCAVRPPGHHAERGRAMGFCLFNNVAVGAAHALARGLERVLIVDFDVHHGNGTQRAFYDDPRVLYVSSHEYPFYPGTGSAAELGEGRGRGFTLNLPLPAGCGDAEYAALYRQVVAPVGRAYDPQLVLVSAGFDPHEDDPLAGMRLTPAGFADVMSACLDAAGAAASRVVVALEGGYDLAGIEASAAPVTQVLLGDPVPRVALRSAQAERLVDEARRRLREFWPL